MTKCFQFGKFCEKNISTEQNCILYFHFGIHRIERKQNHDFCWGGMLVSKREIESIGFNFLRIISSNFVNVGKLLRGIIEFDSQWQSWKDLVWVGLFYSWTALAWFLLIIWRELKMKLFDEFILKCVLD